MASVAPELKKLQAKYKDDKQRQQQEIMKFYSENKINPFASCLPLLAQFPFFIGLYYLLQATCASRSAAAPRASSRAPTASCRPVGRSRIRRAPSTFSSSLT